MLSLHRRCTALLEPFSRRSGNFASERAEATPKKFCARQRRCGARRLELAAPCAAFRSPARALCCTPASELRVLSGPTRCARGFLQNQSANLGGSGFPPQQIHKLALRRLVAPLQPPTARSQALDAVYAKRAPGHGFGPANAKCRGVAGALLFSGRGPASAGIPQGIPVISCKKIHRPSTFPMQNSKCRVDCDSVLDRVRRRRRARIQVLRVLCKHCMKLEKTLAKS